MSCVCVRRPERLPRNGGQPQLACVVCTLLAVGLRAGKAENTNNAQSEQQQQTLAQGWRKLLLLLVNVAICLRWASCMQNVDFAPRQLQNFVEAFP